MRRLGNLTTSLYLVLLNLLFLIEITPICLNPNEVDGQCTGCGALDILISLPMDLLQLVQNANSDMFYLKENSPLQFM